MKSLTQAVLGGLVLFGVMLGVCSASSCGTSSSSSADLINNIIYVGGVPVMQAPAPGKSVSRNVPGVGLITVTVSRSGAVIGQIKQAGRIIPIIGGSSRSLSTVPNVETMKRKSARVIGSIPSSAGIAGWAPAKLTGTRVRVQYEGRTTEVNYLTDTTYEETYHGGQKHSGSYTYQKTGANMGKVVIDDIMSTYTMNFTFTSATGGEYVSTSVSKDPLHPDPCTSKGTFSVISAP